MSPGSTLAVRVLGLIVILTAFWLLVTRPHRRGHLCLTNWRLLYYERGDAFARSYHYVATSDLADVVGVETVYERRWLGATILNLLVHTKHDDVITIRIGETGGLLTKIPILRLLFWRRSIGKDAFQVPPRLFRLIRERQGYAVNASSKF